MKSMLTGLLLLLLLGSTAHAENAYYRYPAVHGDTLVFTAEGDLWRVALAGGSAQRLTTHAGLESEAAISADGEGKIGIAVDTDDASLNKLYGFLGQHPEIQLSVAREAFSDIVYQADLVLCLALTHHLLLSQGLTMADVAKKLRSMCLRYLITEFMPHGLGGTAHIPGNYPDPLPAGYSLPDFLAALRAEFATVQVIDYVRESAPSRRSWCCAKPHAPEAAAPA